MEGECVAEAVGVARADTAVQGCHADDRVPGEIIAGVVKPSLSLKGGLACCVAGACPNTRIYSGVYIRRNRSYCTRYFVIINAFLIDVG